MAPLEKAITDYLSFVQQTSSRHQLAATSQALSLFLSSLSRQQNLPPNNLSLLNLEVGGFQQFHSWLRANRSVETEHQYTRATFDFLQFINDRYSLHLPLDALSEYLATNRRQKSHEIQQPPLSVLRKIVEFARYSSLPDNLDIDRDTLRFYRDRSFILTLSDTGRKISQLCELRISDLPILSNSPCISSSYRVALKSYLKQRSTLDQRQLLPPNTLPVFSRHDKRASDKILPISRWTANNIISSWLDLALPINEREILKQHDITITSQSFRDAFVLFTLYRTNDIEATMRAAGHSDVTTTRRYLHVLDLVADEVKSYA